MHQYLSAIGFKNIFQREYDMDLMLGNLYQTYDSRQAVRGETAGCATIEMSKIYGPGMGLRLCGQMDGQGFHRMYYFPYFEGSKPTVSEEVTVGAAVSGEGYHGVLEAGFVNLAVIFFLQNPVQYLKESFHQMLPAGKVPVVFTGLSNGGVILLGSKPVRENEQMLRLEDQKERSALIASAKKGSADAVESLTMDDMDTYAMLSRRIGKEDLYSIVESSFMPTGMECDQYRILGTILFYTKVQNAVSKQYVYQLTILCNGIELDICINQQDLLGDPEVGRRFKGTVWLQGKLKLGQADGNGEKIAARAMSEE